MLLYRFIFFITLISNCRNRIDCFILCCLHEISTECPMVTVRKSWTQLWGTPGHTQFMSCRSSLVIIQHPPLRVIDKAEWTNTLPKHATSQWASRTVIQNKQEVVVVVGGAGEGDAQLSGGYRWMVFTTINNKCRENSESVHWWGSGAKAEGRLSAYRSLLFVSGLWGFKYKET